MIYWTVKQEVHFISALSQITQVTPSSLLWNGMKTSTAKGRIPHLTVVMLSVGNQTRCCAALTALMLVSLLWLFQTLEKAF